MDAISFSTGLEWLFAFVFALPILLLIVSVMIWAYKNFKHLAFIAYIVDIVFTLFVLWTDISNVAIYFSCGNSLYNLCIINCVFLLILAFIAYIVDIVFTLFVLWTDISNVAIYFSCGNSLYNLCIINCVFLLISIICMFISIVYYRKNKVLGNISINIATMLSVITWFTVIKMVNM